MVFFKFKLFEADTGDKFIQYINYGEKTPSLDY